MKVIAINGSPRKKGNTATILTSVLEGAASVGAVTKLYNLYDYKFKGCISCFKCKKKDTKYVCRCAMKDDLTGILDKMMEADAWVIGSPVYINNISGMTQCLTERLVFPAISYDAGPLTRFTGKIHAAFIYTMNTSTEQLSESGFLSMMETNKKSLAIFNGVVEQLVVGDTLQFKNYSKYAASLFDETHKRKVREEQFPLDRIEAFKLGKRLSE